ncbi:hypothetical protein EDD17DRAFT_1511080 [Pisolithus thermaeus]|nr:hypothetical protein EDD17DRAFT_1511080 [Pisolithus thermaeus]
MPRVQDALRRRCRSNSVAVRIIFSVLAYPIAVTSRQEKAGTRFHVVFKISTSRKAVSAERQDSISRKATTWVEDSTNVRSFYDISPELVPIITIIVRDVTYNTFQESI